MKRIIAVLLFCFIGIFSYPTDNFSQSKKPSDKTVKTYKKKDGTVVKEHKRSAKNNTKKDNFSTKGNKNPYTGKKGYKK